MCFVVRYLGLHRNQLSGTIPSSLSALPALTYVLLEYLPYSVVVEVAVWHKLLHKSI